MRTPTPPAEIYRWHRDALAGRKPAITHEPQAGWFVRRLVRGGPQVPARIWLEQQIDPDTGELIAPEILRCEVGGKEQDPIDQWTYLCAHPVTEAEFLYRMADAAWLRSNVPGAPEATPDRPIASRSIPALF